MRHGGERRRSAERAPAQGGESAGEGRRIELAQGGGYRRRRAERQRSLFRYAGAPLRASPALSLTLRRRSLSGIAGAIPPPSPALSSALRRRYLSRCAGAILCV